MKKIIFSIFCFIGIFSCSKTSNQIEVTDSFSQKLVAGSFYMLSIQADNQTGYYSYNHISINPTFTLTFSKPVDTTTVLANIQFKENTLMVPVSFSYQMNNKIILVHTNNPLKYLTKYTLNILPNLKSTQQQLFQSNLQLAQITTIDSTDKYPRITDNKLLNLVQEKSFNYFWIWGHPLSGMARERFTSGEVVTTGGTGFAVMSIPIAIERNFITRVDGIARVKKITDFLDSYASKYHGAFAHWINGNSGSTIPFSTHDDGADLVETSYLMAGLLTARQYFNGSNTDEINLRKKINKLYKNVEWDWFRNGGQNTLYWHWSPNYAWDSYQQVNGWNEALITYVMSASSPTHKIDSMTYINGWGRNGNIKNGNSYYGNKLPLGPSNGGPLFFEHYSFLGINPNGLTDAFADYQEQTLAHSQINYNYCVANPKRFNGYSDSCWGLTACDNNISGYAAHEPNNDLGIIAPTAALSSFPYTPTQSMAALQFFYYKLGDKLWSSYYGFKDAFNLTNPWFDNNYLAIDQMPIVIMIENYRSGLIWNLFMSCPEVKKGMKGIGFQGPNL